MQRKVGLGLVGCQEKRHSQGHTQGTEYIAGIIHLEAVNQQTEAKAKCRGQTQDNRQVPSRDQHRVQNKFSRLGLVPSIKLEGEVLSGIRSWVWEISILQTGLEAVFGVGTGQSSSVKQSMYAPLWSLLAMHVSA